MKIAILPKTVWAPGQGDIVANQLEVRVASYELGSGATAFYDLQRRKETPATVTEDSFGLSGNVGLTPAQFAAWALDDTYFAKSVASNLGLTPV